MNVRHDVDQEIVKKSIESKIAWYETKRVSCLAWAHHNLASFEKDPSKWGKQPESVESVELFYNNAIWREVTTYSTVRVIELPREGKRFVLVYGGVEDAAVISGTGPFESFDAAVSWFSNNGR